ncbi:MAG: hypothetical protein IPH24_08075 [Crocinitomicaceae bacterium]|nr:hypothetical protein [Crocinitomicaceae bacterium]
MAKRGEYFSEILSQETFASTEFIETINMDSVRNAIWWLLLKFYYDTNGVCNTPMKKISIFFISFLFHFKAIHFS